jgi:hypothetical protein
MYVGTLASYLQAVGADREIRAVFPMDARLRSRSFLKIRFSQSAFFAGGDHGIRQRSRN